MQPKLFAFVLLALLWVNNDLMAQCTFTNAYYDDFEYSTPIPGLVPGTTYHPNPSTYASHWGLKGVYMNFVNNLPTNSLVLSRSFAVCPNSQYRVRIWLKEINGGSSTITLRLRDSNNNILTTYTSTFIQSMGWVLWTSPNVIPTSGTLYFELIFVSGVGNNDFGMDDLYMDICTPPVSSQPMNLCSNSIPINLYDSLVTPTSITGTWSGPSTLNNGYLGTFNANSMLGGTYNYTVSNSISACPDSVGSFNLTLGLAPVIDLGNDTSLCTNDTLLLDAFYPNSTYVWQDGSVDSSFNVTSAGMYTVTVTNDCGAIDIDTIIIGYSSYPIVSLGNDSTLCDLDTLRLNVYQPNATYLWQDNSVDSNFNITNSGTYWVGLTINNCSSFDTVITVFTPLPSVNLGPDTTICQGDSILLNAMNPTATFLWQDNSTNSTFQVSQLGQYWVEVTANNCVSSDSILFNIQPLPIVNLGQDTSVCNGYVLSMDAFNPNGTYLWQDNSVNSSLNVTVSGSYWVEVDVNTCVSSDTINVVYNPIPVIDLGNDTVICFPDTLVLDASYPGATYMWQNNSALPQFNAHNQGLFYVSVTRFNCNFRDSISITVEPKPDADLGNDTVLCTGNTFLLSSSSQGASFLWQDGSTKYYNQVYTAGQYWIEVTKGNCFNTDTIFVTGMDEPIVNIGNDTSICPYDSVLLSTSNPFATYAWSTGEVDSSITVNQKGQYWVEVTNACGTTTDKINLFVIGLPEVDLGEDMQSCFGDEVILDASWPNSTYEWTDGSAQETYTVYEAGEYLVSVTNKCGTTKDTVLFEFKDCDCLLFIPNAFTPNGDNIDEAFGPVANCELKAYSLVIFDRWGMEVFSTENPNAKWDGTSYGKWLANGVYSYVIKFNFEKRGAKIEYEVTYGDVTLMR